jgi:hypothetical protein
MSRFGSKEGLDRSCEQEGARWMIAFLLRQIVIEHTKVLGGLKLTNLNINVGEPNTSKSNPQGRH